MGKNSIKKTLLNCLDLSLRKKKDSFFSKNKDYKKKVKLTAISRFIG